MSADRPEPGEFADDRDPDANRHDPHGIVPDDFVEAWDRQADTSITTIPEALAFAEDAPSTTPASELRRCPECKSTRLRHKPGAVEMEHKRPEDWKCTGCGAHFDEPLEPLEDEWPGKQQTFDEVRHQ